MGLFPLNFSYIFLKWNDCHETHPSHECDETQMRMCSVSDLYVCWFWYIISMASKCRWMLPSGLFFCSSYVIVCLSLSGMTVMFVHELMLFIRRDLHYIPQTLSCLWIAPADGLDCSVVCWTALIFYLLDAFMSKSVCDAFVQSDV